MICPILEPLHGNLLSLMERCSQLHLAAGEASIVCFRNFPVAPEFGAPWMELRSHRRKSHSANKCLMQRLRLLL